MSHTSQPKFRIFLPLFLTGISLLLSTLIFSEVFLSYAEGVFTPLLSPDSTLDAHAVEVSLKLEILEWHVRAHSSALAFGAFVFGWYQVFIALAQLLTRLWAFLGSGSWDIETDGNKRRDCTCSMECRDHNTISGYYVGFLLAVIILNDSIYNRCRNSISVGCSSVHSSVPLSSLHFSYSTMVSSLLFIQQILPNAFSRFSSMASRSLPICAVEGSVLFLVLYGIGILFPSESASTPLASSSPNSRSMASEWLALGSPAVATAAIAAIRLPDDTSTDHTNTSFLNSDTKKPLVYPECRPSLAQWGFNPSDTLPRSIEYPAIDEVDGAGFVVVRCTEQVGSHDDEKKDLGMD